MSMHYGPDVRENLPARKGKVRQQRRAYAPDYLRPDEPPGEVPDIAGEYAHNGTTEEYWEKRRNQTQDERWVSPEGG